MQKLVNGETVDMTDAEIEEVTARQTLAEAEAAANAYKQKRSFEYPSIEDQLDEIYHNGIDAWKAIIKTTKDKYPKP